VADASRATPPSRFALELTVLNDLGFHDLKRAETALRLSDGDIEGSVEILMRDADPSPLERSKTGSTEVSEISLGPPSMFLNSDSLARRSDSRASAGDFAPETNVYETELRVLASLGLSDTVRNMAALRQSNGDVEKALDLLADDVPEALPSNHLPNLALEPDTPSSYATIDEPPVLRFSTHLRVLDDLGFSDTPLNVSLLVKHAGDIDAVMEELYEYDSDPESARERAAQNPMIEEAIGPAVLPEETIDYTEDQKMMLDMLADLGFRDREGNERILREVGWDLDRGVDVLLSGS
jgi:hypothetical protein